MRGLLLTQPKPDETTPHAQCSGKGSGKGSGKDRPLRVPQMGEEDGPKWTDDGWVASYKLRVVDLPSDINKVTIGQYCHGQKDISAQSRKTRSSMAYAFITFTDVALAIKAFEQLSMAKFEHGTGQTHWPVAKWYRRVRK